MDIERAIKESYRHDIRPDSFDQTSVLADNASAVSDRFEWSEASLASPAIESPQARKEGPDGMASLSTRQADAGYLDKHIVSTEINIMMLNATPGTGSGSGSSLMEAISKLLPEHPEPGTERVRSHTKRLENGGRADSTDMLLAKNLADTHVIEDLIHTYFSCYNPSYPILHEQKFRAKYEKRCHIHQSSSLHAAFFMVLAIGSWKLGAETEPKAYDFYAYMSLRTLEAGNVHTVEVFLLMIIPLVRLRLQLGLIF